EVVPGLLTNFMTGVWAGYITLNEPVERMLLEARDDAGHIGLSAVFSVGARDDIGVMVQDSPDVVILGDTLTYRVAVTNTGPSKAIGVVLTNALPPEVAFISASTFHGECSNLGGSVVCNFQDIPPGDAARV